MDDAKVSEPKSLYDEDFVAWTEEQGKALRAAAQAGSNIDLDWENLAEEIESLGRSDKRELHSQIYRIIRHLAKLQFSPVIEPRPGWRESVVDGRVQTEFVLEDSPSLRRELERAVALQTPKALKRAAFDLTERGEVDATTQRRLQQARYTIDQVLGDWFPPNPGRK